MKFMKGEWGMKRLFVVGVMLLILGLIAACGAAQPETVKVVETVVVEVEKEVIKEVEKEVEVIQTVEIIKEVEVQVTAEAPKAGPEGTLTVALSTSPNSLDLATAAERQASNASWQLYDSLIWLDEEGEKQPALAESWEVSEDGTEYTFKLRQGVTFHNGEPFNADSVVFSWERASQPTMPWSDRWTVAKTVEKVDDYTVKMTTEGPSPLLLTLIAGNWAMVPPKYLEEVGEEGFAEKPVGTGPFRLVEWKQGDRIVMEANPDYWEEGLPKLQNLIFRPIPESSTRVAAIQTGDVDIATRLSAEEAQTLMGEQNIMLIRYPIDRVFYIAFNNLTTGKGQPTEDSKVRQAMNHAIDIQTIIDSLFEGYARPATSLISSNNLGYDESLQPFEYNPEKARELLAEAGYPDGFTVDFACPAGAYTNFEQVCEAIQGYLAEVGIQTNLEIMESGQYWDLESKKELPPLFGDSWAELSGEALPRLKGALGGMEASYSAWSSPEIDALLKEIGTTLDDEARADLYTELHHLMAEDPPFIYLYEPVTFEAINPRVQNYKPRGSEEYFLKEVWVLPESE
jgi:peptide/nickel transport system substrate-binding protein